MKGLFQKILNSLKEIGLFLVSWVFIKNLITMLAIVATLLFLVFAWMKYYTKHGETITVPDYLGVTLEEVEQQIKDKHLRYQVMDSTYDASQPPLTVLDQDPLPLSKVKENRTIYFTVNRITPPLTKLPDIWGRDFNFVKAVLGDRDIKIDSTIYREDPAENTVLEVRYKNKTLKRPVGNQKSVEVPRGSGVTLVIASGRGSLVSIPDLACKTVEEGLFTIENYSLNVGLMILDPDVSDTMAAYIWKQIPAYQTGETMNMGEQVDIFISINRPTNCIDDSFDF